MTCYVVVGCRHTSITVKNFEQERIQPMREQVEKALGEIRPALQAHGGDVELVDVSDDGVVKVKLTGACGGCPMAAMTLKQGVERGLKERVPEVVRVDSV